MRLCGEGQTVEKRGAGEEAQTGDMILAATCVFPLFPTTDCVWSERLSSSETDTNTQRYFLLGVRGGQAVLWMTG